MLRRHLALVLTCSVVCVLAACSEESAARLVADPLSTTACAALDPATHLHSFRLVFGQSAVSYAVHDPLHPGSDVVGSTHAVQGEVLALLDGSPAIVALRVSVNLSMLTSDNAQRDSDLHQHYLESDRYPLAQFTTTVAQSIPAGARSGQAVAFALAGAMTLHGHTRPLSVRAHGRLSGGTITGIVTGVLHMQDFGISPPGILGMLKVDSAVTITMRLTATEQRCSQLRPGVERTGA